eukprot:Em0001g3537a
MTVAKEALTDPVTKKHVVEMLGKELASESLNTRHLKEFSFYITTQIPLGIQFKDENKTEDIVEIMAELQQYVPYMVEVLKDVYVPNIDKTVQVVETLSHPIEFAGDQKTAARGRGAQKAKTHESSLSGRLAGLVPVAADWHTKVKLLDVIWKFFYSSHSGGDFGTL